MERSKLCIALGVAAQCYSDASQAGLQLSPSSYRQDQRYKNRCKNRRRKYGKVIYKKSLLHIDNKP